jgi:hypothetical protein
VLLIFSVMATVIVVRGVPSDSRYEYTPVPIIVLCT